MLLVCWSNKKNLIVPIALNIMAECNFSHYDNNSSQQKYLFRPTNKLVKHRYF